MYTAEDFRLAYEDYVQFNKELYDRLGPMGGIAGLLGFGKRPGNDPGHMKFLNEMEAAIKKVIEQKPDQRTADAIMKVIFGARNVYTEQKVSPYVFTAVEGMTIDLIPMLSESTVQELYEEYKKIPRSLRVPVMKNVMAELKKYAPNP